MNQNRFARKFNEWASTQEWFLLAQQSRHKKVWYHVLSININKNKFFDKL